MISTVKIVFFSGTGCTALSADTLKRSLEKLAISVVLEELRGPRTHTAEVDADMFVLMFPIHAFDAPLPLYEYLDHLRQSDKQKVALVSVSGGGEVVTNRASRFGIIRLLKQKGYETVYESTIVMPCNTVIYTPEPVAAALLEKLPFKCEQIAADLAQGTLLRTNPPLLDRLFSKMGAVLRGSWGCMRFGERLQVSSACDSCGQCARDCPRNNIDMVDGIPHFRTDCALCLRCIYECQQNAISAGCGAVLVLKDGFSLESYKGGIPPPLGGVDSMMRGVIWKGVRQYLAEKL